MSFDDYVHQMTHKYRLAVAIVVLKTKPEDITIEQHIYQLKDKIEHNEMDIEDIDITVCSDDFNFDDDDTSFNNNDDTNIFNDDFNDTEHAVNESQTLMIEVDNEDNDSMMILKGFDDMDEEVQINKECDVTAKSQSMTDVLRLLSDIDETTEVMIVANTPETPNFSQNTYYEASQTIFIPTISKTTNVEEVTEANTCVDSNARYDNINENSTYIYESESRAMIDKRLVANVTRNVNKELLATTQSNMHGNNRLNHKDITTKENINKLDAIEICTYSYDDKLKSTGIKNTNNLEPRNTDGTNYDSQGTLLYTVPTFTENYTHVSQSQDFNIKVADKFIVGNKTQYNSNNGHKTTEAEPYLTTMQNAQDFSCEKKLDKLSRNNINAKDIELRNDTKNSNMRAVVDNETLVENPNSQTRTINSNMAELYRQEDTNIPIDLTTNKVKSTEIENYNIQTLYFTQNAQIINTDPIEIQYVMDKSGTLQVFNNTRDKQKFCQVNNTETETNTEVGTSQIEENTKEKEDITEELTVSQAEIVPFKVIEELNKIKTFLNRRVERRVSTEVYSGDSGYKGDSQSRSAYRSALQVSGNWLNQSAQCLYNFITQRPLVATTEDITKEISQVLGKVIDRLHAQESYPPFLEELLEYIDLSLCYVFEGKGSCENVLLKKDESIQRIFLLNKSLHILKYTIEKITNILENIYEKLTSEGNLYELTNIDETENISYVFHILEIILQRYINSNKYVLSQTSTKGSQDEEKVTKRSSISDIWRKKWNPSYKEGPVVGSVEKVCVLTKCGEVLNKIIVECIEGYSLVAFAALQCFNLLQS